MWQQATNPFHQLALSAGAAFVPILALFLLLITKKLAGHLAAVCTLILALLVAILAFGMPVKLAALATLYGVLNGLVPYRLDTRFRRLFVQPQRQKRRLRHGLPEHRGCHGGPALAGAADRLFPRRVSGRVRGLRSACCHHDGHAGRARLPAAVRRRHLPDRQQCAGRLRQYRHSGGHGGADIRGRPGSYRTHDRPSAAAVVLDPSLLAHPLHVGLEGHERSLAGHSRDGRLLQPDPLPSRDLPGAAAARYPCVPRFP